MFQPILMTCFIVFSTCYTKVDNTIYATEAQCLVAAEEKAGEFIKYIEMKTKEMGLVTFMCKEIPSV